MKKLLVIIIVTLAVLCLAGKTLIPERTGSTPPACRSTRGQETPVGRDVFTVTSKVDSYPFDVPVPGLLKEYVRSGQQTVLCFYELHNSISPLPQHLTLDNGSSHIDFLVNIFDGKVRISFVYNGAPSDSYPGSGEKITVIVRTYK